MKKFLGFLLISMVLFQCNSFMQTHDEDCDLVVDGKSEYVICCDTADSVCMSAAKELQFYIKEVSGAELKISKTPGPMTIFLGEFAGDTVHDELGDDGFIIQTHFSNIYISGNNCLSTAYGVYSFIEEYLGVKKLSPDETIIPKNKNIRFKHFVQKEIPAFDFRQIHIVNGYNPEFALWHKLHDQSVRDSQWGLYVHTFKTFISPEKYFKSHPEYFTYQSGERIADAQLCLSNEDVFTLIRDDLKKRIAENPKAIYWSVSQNDTYQPCQCEKCLELDKKYGGPSGTLIWFVNRIAKEFPDKQISTLAYQYTRHAPKNIKPEPNVNIMLCTIECDRNRPISEDQSEGSFAKDIVDWGKLTDNIYLWDYVVQFRNYADPFPNLHVLQPNIKFFRDNNVKLMFQQGSGNAVSDLHDLKAYMIAKLLWNPDVDIEKVKNEFIHLYYGEAAPYIKEYIDLMHNELVKSGGTLNIYGYPWDGVKTYLKPELLDKYTKILDNAELSLKNSPNYRQRVKNVRLSLEFAILEISKRNITPKYSVFIKENGQWIVNPEMKTRLDNIVKMAKDAGLTMFEEMGHPTPDEYKILTEKFFETGMANHLAVDKKVQFINKFSGKYDVGGEKALTDGLKGDIDFHCNWLGFEATNMEIVIDLEKVTEVKEVSADFIQDLVYWIWIPDNMEVFLSEDGKEFKKAGEVKKKTPYKTDKPVIETFTCKFPVKKARYIKVKTQNIIACPDWHKGAGGMSWIFTDEVEVR